MGTSSGQTLIFAGIFLGCRGFSKKQTLSLMILQCNWENKIYTHEISRKHSRWCVIYADVFDQTKLVVNKYLKLRMRGLK